MTDRNWEDSFDRELCDLLPEEISENLSDAVNPWRLPIMQIVWGLGLTSLKLHFFNLDTILPAFGWLLLYLGFRSIRRENRWFSLAWLTSLAGLCATVGMAILNSTIWMGTVYSSHGFMQIRNLLFLVQPAMDFFFWMGLRDVRKQAGAKPGVGAALALLLWHLVILALGLLAPKLDFLVLMLFLLAACVGILAALSRIPRALETAGYGLKASPVRVSDGLLATVLTGVTVMGIACGLLFCQKYPMDWTPVSVKNNPQAEQVREELLDLGFPELVLRDLTEEEVLAMQGSTRVLSNTDVYPVNEGRMEEMTEPDGTKAYGPVYDKKELRITGVAVQLPGDHERWQIIHHFLWEEQPEFFGTEAIRLIPASYNFDGWTGNDDLTGRLLCEKNGETMEAPYWFLGEKEVIHGGFWGDSSTERDLLAAFSLPDNATRQRGYLSYSVSEVQDGCIIFSWMDYVHRDSPLLYPNQSAMDHILSGVWDLKHRFPSVTTDIQFYPFYDNNELFGQKEKDSRAGLTD